jgi:ABC-type nitrate/sulfonate/bicarbonate transport system ATPase subunit
MTPKISVEGLHKAFRTPKGDVPVLVDVSLDVMPGEFVVIVGPSGCGKSTLLACIAGFEPWDRGRIRVDGAAVTGPSKKRVFVFQEPGIFPWLSVGENIAFGLEPSLSAADKAAIVKRHVELVGLTGFERSLPSELSGGMKQRVEFARALAVDPDVLFLDEPFGALDALTRVEMRREIVALWEQTKKTCVLVTHDVEEAVELGGRVMVMGRRPARIEEIVENDLPRPRDPDALAFRARRAHLFAALGVDRGVESRRG